MEYVAQAVALKYVIGRLQVRTYIYTCAGSSCLRVCINEIRDNTYLSDELETVHYCGHEIFIILVTAGSCLAGRVQYKHNGQYTISRARNLAGTCECLVGKSSSYHDSCMCLLVRSIIRQARSLVAAS